MKNKFIEIDGKRIGSDYKPYIIAELSANHNGSIESALKTIESAAENGADAIKIQTYTADTMTIDCDKSDFQIQGGLWDGYNLYQLYKEAHTPFEWHEALFDKAKSLGITIFSTPFDESAVELLEQLETPAYKIASFEITDLPLIARVAKTGKPMILSTGMANLDEIQEAVETARNHGCQELVVLHCISAYPAPVEEANLATIPDLAKRLDVISGLSDHSLGTAVSVASVSMGACVIEKHFILDRKVQGPDSEFSIEPNELKLLVNDASIAFKARGEAGYSQKNAEKSNLRFRRSIYFVKAMKEGETIKQEHIRRIRPGFGLEPKYFDSILGRKTLADIEMGTPVSWELISE